MYCLILLHIILMQTDMMDLLGSDLPTQKDNGMEFSWSDGILLKVGINFLNFIPFNMYYCQYFT